MKRFLEWKDWKFVKKIVKSKGLNGIEKFVETLLIKMKIYRGPFEEFGHISLYFLNPDGVKSEQN